MKISIITAVRNNEQFIEQAVLSVINQTYTEIEYIVIDGNSSDSTLKILNSYKKHFTHFVSEPDSGIYDALNKGIALASGEYIGFLHSDDLYPTNSTVEQIAQELTVSKSDSLYGDLIYVRKNNASQILRYWKSGNFSESKLSKGWMPPHPTFFVKKQCYNQFGTFNTNFRIAADYELILRFLGKHKISTCYLPQIIYTMRVGGESNRSAKNILRKMREDYRALINNNVGGVGSLFLKNVSKIPQFFKR